MKKTILLFAIIILASCKGETKKQSENVLINSLAKVADSITYLMKEYHYNPNELLSDNYIAIDKRTHELASKVNSKDLFVEEFNKLWSNGPFSHVSLSISDKKASEMAIFFDSLRVGSQSVSLEWKDKTAILTVNTMMGLDTYERIFEVYQEVSEVNASSLIIDLRDNPGGTFAIVPLVSHLLDNPIDAGMFVSHKWWRNNNNAPSFSDTKKLTPWQGWSLQSFWRDVQLSPLTRIQFQPMQPKFNGRVFVLTSHESASATEFAVDALAQLDNVIIIGETTAGEMLSQKMFDLPHGLQLSLPIAEYYSSRIGRIEGKGVKPNIEIDQSVALDLAISLIKGEKLEDALEKAQEEITKMDEQPLGAETLYLFGNMNDWGKKWDKTPLFEYKGNGVYEATTKLNKGRYEFKIAPMNWNFDYGAIKNQENVVVGHKKSLAKTSGSGNLIIDIEDAIELTFSLDVSNEKALVLSVSKK